MNRMLNWSGMISVFIAILTCNAQAQDRPKDEWLTKPVDDQTYQAYLDFFAYDSNLDFNVRVLGSEETEGLLREHISFQSTPGEQVFAHLYRLSSLELKGAPAIIALHGGSGSAKEAAYFTRVVEVIVRAGWAVLAIDMKYFGERRTDLLQTFSEVEKHDRLYNQESTYLDWMIQTVKDVSRSYDFLVKEREVDPNRIALLGFSRGAVVSFIAGAVETRLAGVVALHGGHFDRSEDGHLPAACPANYIGRISPRPILMINGERDNDFFKEASVLPLQKLAKQPYHFRWNDTGHAVLTEQDDAVMIQWLRENIWNRRFQ